MNAGKSQWHCVDNLKKKLTAEGADFEVLDETNQPWALKPNKAYLFTRNYSTIVAFRTPPVAPTHFKVFGCHTDSPCITLAPKSKLDAYGFKQLTVHLYGGGLWHTWFDRDLSMAGKIIIKKDGVLTKELWDIPDPVVRIPNLAIHLTAGGPFNPDPEKDLKPILATAIVNKLTNPGDDKQPRHAQFLLDRIAKDKGCKVEDIIDFEINLFDTQPASISGFYQEFLHAGH